LHNNSLNGIRGTLYFSCHVRARRQYIQPPSGFPSPRSQTPFGNEFFGNSVSNGSIILVRNGVSKPTFPNGVWERENLGRGIFIFLHLHPLELRDAFELFEEVGGGLVAVFGAFGE